jgi:conjugative transfer signal peptidase TraF
MWPKSSDPLLLWNMSPSVPLGLYYMLPRQPTTGALAVVRLPKPFLDLVATRRYLPTGAFLIKPVAASTGDVVCRHGSIVAVNGRTAAIASSADASCRPLPKWTGCIRLDASEVFVLSAEPHSFDSRYFGPIDRRNVIGAASLVWASNVTSRR